LTGIGTGKLKQEILDTIMRKFGYASERKGHAHDSPELYSIYRYLDEDGSFDYQLYRDIQIAGNKQKIEKVWVIEKNIEFLSSYLKENLEFPKFGICHGTRRGKEQEWFTKHLGCEVIGTEISDTATQFANTIQWDFHEVKSEWLDSADFIYSNSFDHTYDPENCLNAWMSCLKKNGLCILEHSSLDQYACIDPLDAFGANIIVMPYLIALWGKGRFGVRQILDAPRKNQNLGFLKFIVIQRF
jgi:hypothetical protein